MIKEVAVGSKRKLRENERGLTGGQATGIEFYNSRDLVDSNFTVAEGGRVTLGDPNIRGGASVTHGGFNDPSAAFDLIPHRSVHYTIYGFDFQARYENLLRFQAEYARRENDRVTLNTPTGKALLYLEHIDGAYFEMEARPWRKSRVSVLARFDRVNRNSRDPPPASALPTGIFNVERFTLGVNVLLWRQSLLMLNWERWYLPVPAQRNLNVYGVRYAITF
jgi:hypothetical protein